MQALNILVVLSVGRTAGAMPPFPWSEAVKSYRPWNVEQSYLLPPSPNDWLPEGHLAYFILDVVKMLDLGAITRVIDAKDARGERPYSPFMMTALLLYAYCVGVFSSRRIERATYEDVAFRVIAAGHHPDFTRIADFRRRHIEAFHDIFRQTVELCQKAGLVKLGLVARWIAMGFEDPSQRQQAQGHGATRQGWPGGIGGDDDSLKSSTSSSRCETDPTKVQPDRSVASLAPLATTASAMRRYASKRAG